jgi:hypothetical protein
VKAAIPPKARVLRAPADGPSHNSSGRKETHASGTRKDETASGQAKPRSAPLINADIRPAENRRPLLLVLETALRDLGAIRFETPVKCQVIMVDQAAECKSLSHR